MPQQQRLGGELYGLPHDLRRGEWAELSIKEPHVVAGIEDRPAHREEAERRQLLPRDAAPDGRVGRVDEQWLGFML